MQTEFLLFDPSDIWFKSLYENRYKNFEQQIEKDTDIGPVLYF